MFSADFRYKTGTEKLYKLYKYAFLEKVIKGFQASFYDNVL